MKTRSSAKTSGRLGSRMRGKLAAAYDQRGHAKSCLWYVYSPRTSRDWVLLGNLRFDHFVLTEADPRVKEVDYSPPAIEAQLQDGSIFIAEVDAIVTLVDGTVEWRKIVSEKKLSQVQLENLSVAAAEVGARFVPMNEADLNNNPQRLANWRRVLVWLSAARGHLLESYLNEVAVLIDARGTVKLGEIESHFGKPSFPLYAAAVFRGVQNGDFYSDLDTQPLLEETTIYSKSVKS